jgi:hypothetical protein
MSLDDAPQGLPPAPDNIPKRLDSEPDDAPHITRESVTVADIEQMLEYMGKVYRSGGGYANYSWMPDNWMIKP